MFTPAFRYLEAKTRIGPFTIGLWVQFAIGALVGVALLEYLPLPIKLRFFLVVQLVGIPFAVSYALLDDYFSATRLVQSVWRYRRGKKCYVVDGLRAMDRCYVLENPANASENTIARPVELAGERWL